MWNWVCVCVWVYVTMVSLTTMPIVVRLYGQISHFPMHHLNHLIWKSLYVSARSFHFTSRMYVSVWMCACVCVCVWVWRHRRTMHYEKPHTKTRVNFGCAFCWICAAFVKRNEFNLWYLRSANVEKGMMFSCMSFELFWNKAKNDACANEKEQENKQNNGQMNISVSEQSTEQKQCKTIQKCGNRTENEQNRARWRMKNIKKERQKEDALLHAANHIRRPTSITQKCASTTTYSTQHTTHRAQCTEYTLKLLFGIGSYWCIISWPLILKASIHPKSVNRSLKMVICCLFSLL